MPARPPRRHWRTALVPWLALAVRAAAAAPDDADSVATPAADPLQLVAPVRMPHVPEAVSRPPSWPAGTAKPPAGPTAPDKHILSTIRVPAAGQGVTPAGGAAAVSGGVVPAAHAVVDEAAAVPLETAMIVARVGPEVVLESDLLTPKALEYLDQATTAQNLKPEQVRALRLQICKQVIDQHMETLLVFVDACREIPADKLPEIRKNVEKSFDEQMLPNLMKEANVANSLEYERMLRAKGQSLDRMRKMYFERGLAMEWMRRNVNADEEIPHADLIAWYQNHLADYDYPARARYEILTVKVGPKRSKQEAWDALATMGNEVLAGRPFAEVAKARSEGPTRAAGGQCDWISRGSLASKRLDEAIFTLPAGQLSAIIENEPSPNLADQGTLHIVRVIERQEAGRTPFLEAQVGIRETLREERRKKALDDYLAKLRVRTPVWTVFDDDDAETPRTVDRQAGTATVR
ncbi:MAG: peptidylprolyl isomerase [Planctomycetaceae bacterium]